MGSIPSLITIWSVSSPILSLPKFPVSLQLSCQNKGKAPPQKKILKKKWNFWLTVPTSGFQRICVLKTRHYQKTIWISFWGLSRNAWYWIFASIWFWYSCINVVEISILQTNCKVLWGGWEGRKKKTTADMNLLFLLQIYTFVHTYGRYLKIIKDDFYGQYISCKNQHKFYNLWILLILYPVSASTNIVHP